MNPVSATVSLPDNVLLERLWYPEGNHEGLGLAGLPGEYQVVGLRLDESAAGSVHVEIDVLGISDDVVRSVYGRPCVLAEDTIVALSDELFMSLREIRARLGINYDPDFEVKK